MEGQCRALRHETQDPAAWLSQMPSSQRNLPGPEERQKTAQNTSACGGWHRAGCWQENTPCPDADTNGVMKVGHG